MEGILGTSNPEEFLMKSIRKNMFYALALAILLAGVVIPAFAATTTTTVDSAGFVGSFNSLELNASGFPVISYLDVTNFDLKVAVCGDTTCATKTLTTVDSTGNVGNFTSLELNASGFPVISYYDNTNFDLKVAVCGDATCTSKTITTVDSPGFVGNFNSLALNASGFPVISYLDGTNIDLKVAVCGDATCTSKTITTVDSAGDVGIYTSLALNASGFPVISYLDGTNGDLKVAKCNDATCTIPIITTVDSAADVGYDSSIVLNTSGFPVISYYDITNGDLKVVVCGNATCTSGNTFTILDDAGNVGEFTSLALNTNGFPVISYLDNTNGDLKMVICGDATCTSKTLTTIDSAGNVGFGTSLALNANGFPAISYYDSSNRDLKFATVTPPTVASHTLQASYTGTGPASFTVTFSEDVNNPAGDSGTDDVTNINNYKIINKGANGTVDTASCASAIGGDDSLITPSGVTYAPNTAIVNIGSALPAGSYRLFVCGTTSITDAIGVPLNLGVDSTFDFTVGVAAAASNGNKNTTASSLPKTGFAPGKVTVLPAQPATLAYANLGDLWLEIPSLNVKSTIVGVPQNADKTWSVDWLGNDTGWLNGTAFPTWTGNSVLTAHVTNASGLDGPFSALKSLRYGDQVIVHMGGGQYVYEVRNTRLARPYSTSYAFQSMQDASYLTLVTCSGFNPLNESYLFRRVVRAVLVEVK
jgi:LPXTG-site transpeptidase (sortase) family protein